jgi:uncharacterized protein with FMN-binding domain
MKKIIYWIMATVTGLVLAFSYKTSLGTSAVASALSTSGTSSVGSASGSSRGSASGSSSNSESQSTSGSSGVSSGSTGSGSGGSGSNSSSGLKNGTYTGTAIQTRYGTVQVTVTVKSGKISAVDVPQYPNRDPRDQQINSQAVPQLVSETLSSQSADVQFVSGATFTSDGYQQSLQSALDQAKA